MSKHISLPRSHMWRTRAATALAAAGALIMSGGMVMLAAPAATADPDPKVVVCKYVSTPGGELDHIVIVSENSLNNTPYIAPPNGDSWTDAHGQSTEGSVAIRYATADEQAKDVALSECPGGGTPDDDDLCTNLKGIQTTVPDGYIANEDGTCSEDDVKVPYCHWDNGNGYSNHSNGSAAGLIAGHMDHLKDIWPAFDFKGTHYDAQGDQSILRNGCGVPGPEEIAIPAPPTVSSPDCDSAGSFTVSPHEGMTTFLDGVKVTAPTLVDKAGDYTIGYIANPGSVFESTGKTRASQDITVLPATGDCPSAQIDIPAPPTVSAPDCDSAGSFTVSPHDGMSTFLDGVKVTAPKVVSAAGKYTIGYVAGPGTVFKGTGKTRATQEVVVLAATGNCPSTQTRSVPSAPTPTLPACDVDGSLTLPAAADGLTWAVQQISGTPDNSSPYGPGVYRVTVTSSGLPFSTGGQAYTYPDIVVAPNTGPCALGVQEIAPTVGFTDPTCANLDGAAWSGNLTGLVDYTVSGTARPGKSITVTATIKPAVADQFAFPAGFDNTFDHAYPSKADLDCPTVKGSESSRPKPHKTPTVLGTQAVAPTAVDAGLASLPGDSGSSTTSLLAQLLVGGGLLLLLAGGWLGLGRREDGAHQA